MIRKNSQHRTSKITKVVATQLADHIWTVRELIETKFSLRDLLFSMAWLGLLLAGLRMTIYGWYEAPVGSGLAELLVGIGIISGAFGIVVGISVAHGQGGKFQIVACTLVGFVSGAVFVPGVVFLILQILSCGIS